MIVLLQGKGKSKAHVFGQSEHDVQVLNSCARRALTQVVQHSDDQRATGVIVTMDADPRHVEITLKRLNSADLKAIITPFTKTVSHAKDGDQPQSHFAEKLDGDKRAIYQALVARANYLSPDRAYIAAFSVKVHA